MQIARFKRKGAVEAVKVHGVHPRVALANLIAQGVPAYHSRLTGEAQELTERTFSQWLAEYDQHQEQQAKKKKRKKE